MKPRIAFVIQRYGENVLGGAEQYCRMIAENLSSRCDIDVITTTARDSITWKNFYPTGKDRINDVNVIRFPVDKTRKIKSFNRLTKKLLFSGSSQSIEEGENWLNEQGPVSSKLFRYLEEHSDDYQYFFFFTALYPIAYYGIQKVARKSILIPLAHDEPVMDFPVFRRLFHLPLYIIFSTPEERDFIYSSYRNYHIRSAVIGSGIQTQFASKNLPSYSFINSFPFPFDKDDRFVLYAGRIEPGKGIYELIDFFNRYTKDTRNEIKLIILGNGHSLDTKNNPNIIHAGYVDESIKSFLFEHASAVINPSYYESFSLVLLEAWNLKKPVLVNGKCPVLKGHIDRSQGGMYYFNYNEFKINLSLILNNAKLAEKFGSNGRRYYQSNYSWNIIRNKYLKVMDYLNKNNFLLCG